MPEKPEVRGTVAPGFERVREEFAAALAEESHNEPGSQLTAYIGDRLVVDLAASDDFPGERLTGVYSVTKGATHLVFALLAQDGVIDLDRRVVDYWPEFTGGGKERLRLRGLLAHGAGLIGLHDRPLTLAEIADDRVLAELLAAETPFWEPGSGYGYHTYVIGALTGEVVRRATGSSIQALYEERVRAPYGLDLYLGLPEALEPRYEPVRAMNPTSSEAASPDAEPDDPASLGGIAFHFTPDRHGLDFAVDVPNTREVRAKGQASVGGIGNARGVAGLYAAALTGLGGRPPLLKPATIAEFSTPYLTGTDLVTGGRDQFGLGFERPVTAFPALGQDAFGHCGMAGSLGFADPRSGLAYGYVRRRFAFPGGTAPENARLVRALTEAAADAA
ncbi:serine hydrolase domain-containing protein [Streptomyces montanisoli]|uniref:Beta-lactamase family protein n=1 Tax=Streptomyces montanisoli TaxID=2798581 RepID=A0A940MES5_9ACTN|nr:serine hydrolase domain-containing protein [Streptomyces montanisoli]MBP0459722.1 beta-lactamase family protein [Streptomyces montanisoli]